MNDNLSEEEKNLYRNPDLLKQREELREQINNLEPPQGYTLTAWARGGGKTDKMEQARELAAALATGTFSIELVERLRANTFYVPAGGLVAQAIDFLLEERNKQKDVINRLAEYNNEAAADFDRANGERLKLQRTVEQQADIIKGLGEVVVERDRQAREIAKLKEGLDQQRRQTLNRIGEVAGLKDELERRDTTIQAMRQQLVLAQQRGDELKERCEALVDRISETERREQTWANGSGATYWRTQYEKLSQEHAVIIQRHIKEKEGLANELRGAIAQGNHYKEELNGLIHATAAGSTREMQFFACTTRDGAKRLVDPDAVIQAWWDRDTGDLVLEVHDDSLHLAGNEAREVWNHLMTRPR